MSRKNRAFIAVHIAVLTVSDSRTEADDKSGDLLVNRVTNTGHVLTDRKIVKDDIGQIRGVLTRWIDDADIQVVITTGGTGVTGFDGTPEAMEPLLEKNSMVSVKSFEPSPLRKSAPRPCNPAPWRALSMALTFSVCPAHPALAPPRGTRFFSFNLTTEHGPATWSS